MCSRLIGGPGIEVWLRIAVDVDRDHVTTGNAAFGSPELTAVGIDGFVAKVATGARLYSKQSE